MRGTMDDLMTFWLTPWSQPLRDACEWLVRFGAPLSGKKPTAAFISIRLLSSHFMWVLLVRLVRQIAAVPKPAVRILRGDPFQRLGDGLLQRLVGSCSQSPQPGFQLGERLLDGCQIGRIRGQEEHLAAARLDGLAHALPFMYAQVIQHHDLAWLQAGREDLFDIGLKGERVNRSFQDHRRLDALERQSSEERRIFAPVAWHRPISALATRRSGVERCEGDVAATFIHKHQIVDGQVLRQVTPGRAVCFAALGGTQRLFFLGWQAYLDGRKILVGQLAMA